MEPGGYEAVLLDDVGAARWPGSRSAFGIREAQLELSTDRRTYAPGEPIEVSWADGPANRWDWVGVYKAGGVGPGEGQTT